MAQVGDPFTPKEAILTALPLRFVQHEDRELGRSFTSSVQYTKWQDHFIDRMVHEMTAFVLAEKFVDKKIEKKAFFRATYPASWWQAFKDEVLDRFALTRWFVKWRPVKWTVIEQSETLVANFAQYAKYPAADVIIAPESIHKNIIKVHEMMSWQ